jgi:hypothetical protein
MDIKYWQCSYFDDMTCLGEMNIPMYCFFDVDVGYWSSLKLDAWFSSIFPFAYIYCYGILMSSDYYGETGWGTWQERATCWHGRRLSKNWVLIWPCLYLNMMFYLHLVTWFWRLVFYQVIWDFNKFWVLILHGI